MLQHFTKKKNSWTTFLRHTYKSSVWELISVIICTMYIVDGVNGGGGGAVVVEVDSGPPGNIFVVVGVREQSNCIPRTKYVRGILWFSRRYAAASASASAASADTSSFSR